MLALPVRERHPRRATRDLSATVLPGDAACAEFLPPNTAAAGCTLMGLRAETPVPHDVSPVRVNASSYHVQSSVVLIACILLLLLHGAAAAAVAVVIAAAVRSMAQLLRAVGLEPSDLELKTGDRVRLIASLDTPLGRIELG